MPGPTRDSLSRSEINPYSLHEVRKRPDIKQEPIAPTQPIHKDSIEISRGELHKEALERLRHSSKYVIIQVAFIRIGKYLFVGLTLPPYLILYGIPKWIIKIGLPTILLVIHPIFKKIAQGIQKKFNKIIAKVASSLSWLQNLSKVIIQPIVSLGLYINNGIQHFKQNLIKISNRFAHLKGRVKRALFSPLKMKHEMVQQWVVQQFSKLSLFFQSKMGRVKQILQKINLPFKFFKRLSAKISSFTNLAKPLAKRWQFSQQLATQFSNWLLKQGKQRKIDFKRISQPLKVAAQRSFYSIFTPLRQALRAFSWRTKGFFKQKKESFFLKIKNKLSKLKSLSSASILAKFSSYSFAWLPQFLRRILSKFLLSKAAESCVRVGIKLAYGSLSLFFRFCQVVEKLYLFLVKGMGRISPLIQVKLKQGYVLISKYVHFIQKYIGRILRKTVYHTLVVVVMINLLILWGIQSVVEITSRMLFKDFENASLPKDH